VDSTVDRPFQILSLDGGGVKGLFAAAVLAKLEDDCGVRITDHFDLIAGTSTGGLIAIALGLGMRPRELVDFYVRDVPLVFRNTLGLRTPRHVLRSKFDGAILETALRRRFGDRRFGESSKRLVIPSFNLADNDVYIFRTPHHPRLKRDWKAAAWKVGMATASAPTYFRTFDGIDGLRLVDGGVWANNPTMVAVVEAAGVLGVPATQISVLNIGTTDAVLRPPRRLDGAGLASWSFAISKVLLHAQGLSAMNQAGHLLSKERVIRLSPSVPDAAFALDRINTIDLMALAAHESRKFCPTFTEKFQPHHAGLYQPLYPEESSDGADNIADKERSAR
jgi:patatin-like phospholipase/acyl hydrolase